MKGAVCTAEKRNTATAVWERLQESTFTEAVTENAFIAAKA
jgi:hypothetical protein